MTAAEPVTTLELFGGSEIDPIPNPWPVYRRLRAESPVVRIQSLPDDGYLITRHEDVREALRNDVAYSNRSNAKGIGLVMGRTIVEMDGTEHLRHRNIITPALAPRALKGDFPRIVAEIAHELLDAVADRGQADLVQSFTYTFPLRVFTRILGLPVEDYAVVHDWALDLISVGTDPARGLAGGQKLAEYLAPVVRERRACPTDDLVSRLVHAQVDGAQMSDEEVISFLRLLVIAGAETTYHLIGSALFGLLSHPDQLDAVREDRSLIQKVLDETLRWESPVQIVTRETAEDVEIAGVPIPKASSIVVGVGSANRDERVFDDPDRFDIYRNTSEHIAFGFGKHYCAGSKLAYLEARVAIDAILDRLPGLRFAKDAECRIVGMAFRGPDRLPVEFGR